MRNLLLLGCSLLLTSDLFAVDPPKKLEPIIQMDFSVPNETKGWYGRCDSVEEWRKAWDKYHKPISDGGVQSVPKLDNKKSTIIVICSEKSAAGIRILEVLEEVDCIYVGYSRTGLQYVYLPGLDQAVLNEQIAYANLACRERLAFVVLPAIDKKIVIRECVSGSRGLPRKWEERAVLPPPK